MNRSLSRICGRQLAIPILILFMVTILIIGSALLASTWFFPKEEPAVTLPMDGWVVSSPEDQGMISSSLQAMMAIIDEQAYAYDAVLVTRHGRIVFEQYRNGYNQHTKHHLQSATKSISSLLIGIAIQEGFLEGVDQKIVDLFSDYSIANLDSRKQEITLENLLTMSDGIEWHELDYPYEDPRNTLGQMWSSKDFVQFVLDQPMKRMPGEAWSYNSGTSILLGGIIEETTGLDVLTFANTYFFEPLGITDLYWSKTRGNHYHTDGGLYLTPRDMALIGNLMLNKGSLNGRQIISPDWIARSTRTYYQSQSGKGYGYQWWTMPGNIFLASGHYDQKIYIIPEADMVVVFTANIPDNIIPPSDGFLYEYILKACLDLDDLDRMQSYKKYGFSFEYPFEFEVAEYPIPGLNEITEDSGLIQFRVMSYPFELVQVTWLPAQNNLDLKEYLSDHTGSASGIPGAVFSPVEIYEYTVNKQNAFLQTFEFSSEGIQLKGGVVTWFCADSSRIFSFSYATNDNIPDQDMNASLEKHLGHFNCNEPEVN